MAEPEKKRPVLLRLAAEGVVPVLGGCAGALAGGPEGGLAGVALGQAVEKGINLFGKGIVERWQGWFGRNRAAAAAAVAELATIPPAEAREQVRSIFLDLSPGATAQEISLAVEFVAAIPRAVDRALVPDAAGGRSVPPTVSFDDARSLLQLLPEDVPPYPPTSELPSTPYQLVELIGSGGFGAVYRAVSPTLQHLPLAIKFCLDRSLLPALNQERSNLERLMRAGGRGSGHVVRLYGYDLDHATPYLVYEYVPGGDLTKLVAARRTALGRAPDPAEVLGWVTQIAEGLAFAHRTGLVHRDLKPANVLVAGDSQAGPSSSPELKLADFGLGGVATMRAAARSRIGASTVDYLSLADQASLFRGAGTPLYMSPEQRRGAPPDPRHDLYALGVVWFQLLVGDVSRELHHGWAKELAVRFGVPQVHIGLIERCVGWFDERPRDADELLPRLKEAAAQPGPAIAPLPEPLPPVPASEVPTVTATAAVTATPPPAAGLRRSLLVTRVGQLDAAFTRVAELQQWKPWRTLILGFVLAVAAGWLAWAMSDVSYRSRSSQYQDGASGPFASKAINIGVVTWLGVWLGYSGLVWLVIRVRTENARLYSDALAAGLANEFPAEAAAWGGLAVLQDPVLVRRIRDELIASEPAVAPVRQPSSAIGDARRRGVAASLARLEAAYAELGEMKKWRFEITLVYGFFIGLLVGWLIGEFVYSVRNSPTGFPMAFRGYVDWGANAVGFFAGLFVWGLYVWLIRSGVQAVAADIRKRAEGQIGELVADFPAEVAGWGGRNVLRHPATVRQIRRELEPPAPAAADVDKWAKDFEKIRRVLEPPAPAVASATSGIGPDEVAADPTRKTLLVARLRDVDKALEGLDNTVGGSWVGFVLLCCMAVPGAGGGIWTLAWEVGQLGRGLSLAAGLVAATITAVLSWWAMAAIRRSGRRQTTAAIDRFAADYPRLVESWGGRNVLESRETVGALIKTYSPEPPPEQPGWLGRMFGG
jgi:serine/threonine protein kinase